MDAVSQGETVDFGVEPAPLYVATPDGRLIRVVKTWVDECGLIYDELAADVERETIIT